MISEPCTCCHATGRVEALETSFSKIEHEICRLLVSDILGEQEFSLQKIAVTYIAGLTFKYVWNSILACNAFTLIICIYCLLSNDYATRN